jgi:signal transduction histidine kinase/serine/threonine protein kinase/CheY-like chemotaxis protein/tetratricopeptide (TPR) repeat protein
MNKIIIANKYELRSKITDSGMSEIWLADDLTTKKRVIIKKIIEENRNKNIENILLFKKQAEILRQLKHENIVEIYDVGESDGNFYIAMEYVKGRNLSLYLKTRRKLDIESFLGIAIPLCETLAFIHQQGIMHGDIRPENIMLVADGKKKLQIKLLDFGTTLLKDLAGVYKSRLLKTFAYLSPEQSGVLKRPIDTHSDLYSLGILFYQMLAGKLPYQHDDIYSLIHMHIASEPNPIGKYNSNVPEILEKVIEKLLKKEILDRYSQVNILIRDLINIQRGIKGEPQKLIFTPGMSAKPEISIEHTHFIGRSQELTYLKSIYEETKKGNGKIVLISGESGSGKTRLLEELKEYAVKGGGICVGMEFEEMGNPLPYSGFANCVNQFLGMMEMFSKEKYLSIKNSLARTIGKLGSLFCSFIPKLRDIISIEGSTPPLEGEKEKIRFDNAFLGLLADLGKSLPALVLVIDNLQWADDDTLSLLEKLSKVKKLNNVLFITAKRSIEKTDPFKKYVERLGSGKNISKIKINNFTREEVYHIVFSILGEESPNLMGLGDLIYQKTGGNAFFIIEFMQMLLRNGIISYKDGWKIDKDVIDVLPFTRNIAGLVKNSIEQLSGPEQEVLALAAVFGKEFAFSHISDCYPELKKETIFKVIENAKVKKIVISGGKSIYFSHDIVHEVFYNMIPAKIRKKYHERIAQYLEARGESENGFIYKILYHYQNSNNIEKTIEYLIKAGEFAQDRKSHQDAVRFFGQVFKALDKVKGDKHFDAALLHEKIGESLRHIGNYPDSQKHFRQALQLIQDKKSKVELHKKMSYSLVANGQYDEAIRSLVQSLSLFNENVPNSKSVLSFRLLKEIVIQFIHSWLPILFINHSPVEKEDIRYKKQMLFQMIGWVCIWAIRRELLIYSHFKALNLCNKAGISEEGIELLLTHCAVAISIDGPPAVVKKLYKRINRFLERIKKYIKLLHDPPIIKALYLGVDAAFKLEAGAYLKVQEALKILQEQQTITYLQEISNLASMVFEFHGEFNMLIELAEEVRTKGLIFNNRLLICLGDLYMGIAYYYQGKTEESIKLLETALAEFGKVSDKVNCQYTRLFLIKAYNRHGYFHKAEQVFNQAVEVFNTEHQTHPLVIVRIFPFFLEALLEKFIKYAESESEKGRRLALAKKYYKKCQILAKTYDCHKGMFFKLSAMYAWVIQNDHEKAKRIFEQGREYYRDSPEIYNRAIFLYYYGEFLAPSDPRKAIELLEQAYLELDKCGSVYEMHKIEKLLQELVEERSGVHEEVAAALGKSIRTKPGSFTVSRELDTVIDIGKKINIIHDMDLLMDEILNHAIQLVGAEQGELFLYEDNRPVSKYHVVLAGADELPTSMGVVSKVDYSNEPLVIADARNDPLLRNDPQVLRYGLKSILCIPLQSREKKIGLLYLSNHLVSGLFTEHELDLLNAMAGQAAIVLENSLLFRETKKLQIYLNSIIDSMPVALIALDPQARITYINNEAKTIFPEFKDLSEGETLWRKVPSLKKYENAFEKVVNENRLIEFQKEPIKKQYWTVTIFPLVYEEISGAVVKLNNITEQEKLQQQLIQAQKMEAIGTLVGGLAHDFNNILGGILATSSFLSQSVLPSKKTFIKEDFEEDFKMITSLVDRASNLVQQLLTISMRKEVKFVLVDLNSAVSHVVKICRQSFDKSIEFEVLGHSESAPIMADPVQLEQVILNLCINASHAMTLMRPKDQKWGGTLKINIKKITLYKAVGNGVADAAQGDYFCLSVEDTGVGMDEDTVKKVFEPFFTTKETGKGTGLGLAMVYSIVRSFNGHINVYSEPGQGSIFHVYLPVQKAEEKQHAAEKVKKTVYRGVGTILVIEDEEVIRRSVEKILKSVGYNVLAAANGTIGLELFKEHRKEIMLVLLDMVMPKESGKQVFIEMHKRDPHTRVVLMSGFRKDQRVQEVLAMGVKGFLQKPFNQDELLSMVEKALED